MSLMMPDSGVIDLDRLLFAALLVAPVSLPATVEFAVAVPFDNWSGPSHLVVGVTTDRSAAEAEARRYAGAVLLERADEDDAWTEVAR